MTEKKVYKCDDQNRMCPRVRLLLKLLADGNNAMAAQLIERPYTQTPQDEERAKLFADSQGTEAEPAYVIPVTCDFMRDCLQTAREIQNKLVPPMGRMPGVSPPPTGTR